MQNANEIKEGEMSKTAYTGTARGLHWMMAIAIIGMFAIGWFMMSIEDDPGSDRYFMLHKSIGIVVLLLAFLRMLWRFGNQPALLPEQIPLWKVNASKISHWLLYGTMIAMPLVGLIGTLFSSGGIAFFGFQLPTILAVNHDLSEFFFSMHAVIAWVFAGVITLHVLAALQHLFINKDGVFQRMWF